MDVALLSLAFKYSRKHMIPNSTGNSSFYYSRMHPHAVMDTISKQYALSPNIDCCYFAFGLHDNYLLAENDKEYILRLYRNDWRSLEDVRFELGLLNHLHSSGCAVAYPLTTTSGTLHTSISFPEGTRQADLFSYAKGNAPGTDLSPPQSQILGEAVAQIHVTTDQFSPTGTRQEMDLEYLLDASLNALKGFLSKKQYADITQISKTIKQQMPTIERHSPCWGICIGDVNASNFHLDNNNAITLFDFDQCGYSWRAFEIGKFFSTILNRESKQLLMQAFLQGYQKVRSLSDNEKTAIPLFVKAAIIWVMAIQVYNAEIIGHKWLNLEYWQKRINKLLKLDNDAIIS
ncbi:phosphotransferase enzyme family protein [Kaarinaea lacus]